jgi:hypothetical protein
MSFDRALSIADAIIAITPRLNRDAIAAAAKVPLARWMTRRVSFASVGLIWGSTSLCNAATKILTGEETWST